MALTKVSYSMVDGSVFNVNDYGAVADGVTDCQSALQAAVDAAHANGGGIVYLPAGTYVIKDTAVNMTGKRNVFIQGETQLYGTKILLTGTGHYAFSCIESSPAVLNIGFKNLFIDTDTSYVSNGHGGIKIDFSSAYGYYFDISHVQFFRLEEDALYLNNVATCNVDSISVDVIWKTGVYLGNSRNVEFLNCAVSGSGDGYIFEKTGLSAIRGGYVQTCIRGGGANHGITFKATNKCLIEGVGLEGGGPTNSQNTHILLTTDGANPSEYTVIDRCSFDANSVTDAAVKIDDADQTRIYNTLMPTQTIGSSYSLKLNANAENVFLFGSNYGTLSDGSTYGIGRLTQGNGIVYFDNNQQPIYLGGDIGVNGGAIYQTVERTYTATASGTLAVTGGNVYTISLASAENVTALTATGHGQSLTMHFTNGNATIVNGATIKLQGATNYNPGANDSLTLVYNATIGAWIEKCRSNN